MGSSLTPLTPTQQITNVSLQQLHLRYLMNHDSLIPAIEPHSIRVWSPHFITIGRKESVLCVTKNENKSTET